MIFTYVAGERTRASQILQNKFYQTKPIIGLQKACNQLQITLRIVLGEQDRKSLLNMALKMIVVSLSELLKVADREVKSF